MAKSIIVQGPNGSDTLTELNEIVLTNALDKAGIQEDTVIVKAGSIEFTVTKIKNAAAVDILRNGRRFMNPIPRRRGAVDHVFFATVVDRLLDILNTRVPLTK